MSSYKSPLLVLVVNCGSSSVKYSLLPVGGGAPIASGAAECLGLPEARLSIKLNGVKIVEDLKGGAHEAALSAIFAHLQTEGFLRYIAAVGHRVVQGGERFSESVVVTPEVLADLEKLTPLAPLLHPANMLGIRLCMKSFPMAPQVVVFDTAFHQTLPPAAYTYAIPRALQREHGLRRYGFHGTSHRYVSGKAARMLGLDPDNHGLVIAHLGNGSSATAVLNGRSIDTTMGLTPLEGLVMGTRSGDIDFGAAAYIARVAGLDMAGVDDMLNKKSGLLGISELSSDCRTLENAADEGHEGALLALDVFVHRLARCIGGLATSLPRFDALVFTGGIGENSGRIRAATLRRLEVFGFTLDDEANREMVGGRGGRIDADFGPAALVVPTDEESVIARDAAALAHLSDLDVFAAQRRAAV
ncbi:acetate kinase [Rhodoblastus acidophilus]|uniref:acetate/propionate family kinase n=1 Tax=Rhodoblastus acidophilus TaxID=1074 RepID=UPI002224C21A|nr:acetate kinase [Rhodoblastus acidophilus]MCW2286456.1 acetate kinase [Rhodoblastus acidophilus]MCW2335305.1 acetate kinase [Rhodoblastus acidophilus]